MTQFFDAVAAADFLGITVNTVRNRRKAGKFPEPDDISGTANPDTEWWSIETLDKYQRSLARKKRKR